MINVTTCYNVSGLHNLALKKEVDIKLEEPYNQCKNVSDITYRQADCLVQCKNKNFANNYNCTLRNFYSNSEHITCNKDISNTSEFDSDCQKICPKECTTTKYDILVMNPQLALKSSEKL